MPWNMWKPIISETSKIVHTCTTNDNPRDGDYSYTLLFSLTKFEFLLFCSHEDRNHHVSVMHVFFSSHTKQICFILYFVEVIDEPQISIDFFSTNMQYIYLFVCHYIIWKGTYLSIDFLFNAIRYKTMWSFVGPPIYNSNRYKIWVVRQKMFTPLSI